MNKIQFSELKIRGEYKGINRVLAVVDEVEAKNKIYLIFTMNNPEDIETEYTLINQKGHIRFFGNMLSAAKVIHDIQPLTSIEDISIKYKGEVTTIKDKELLLLLITIES